MKKLLGMLLALCLMCGGVEAIAADNSGLVKSSYFEIDSSTLESFFSTNVLENPDINNEIPLSVRGTSIVLNRYINIDVYRYTDDITLGGVSVKQLVEETNQGEYALTGDVHEKYLCNLAYNTALAHMGRETLSDIATYRYKYIGGCPYIFIVFSVTEKDVIYAMCHSQLHCMAYVFEIGRIDSSKPAQLDNDTILTMLIQYMKERERIDTSEGKTTDNPYIIITSEKTWVGFPGNKVKTVYKGETFPLEGEDDDYYIIKIEGVTGYVKKDVSAIYNIQDNVVITGDSAKVRTEASISSGLIRTVYKGESFPCEGESGDFYIIEIDGKTGYVHKGVAAIQ